MIRIYRLNCGSNGADDAALGEAVRLSRELTWAETPADADVFALTGPITQVGRPALLRVWREQIKGKAPLVAIGRASIDGHPFGRGGLAEMQEVIAAVKVGGSPPELAAIQSGLLQAVKEWPRSRDEGQ